MHRLTVFELAKHEGPYESWPQTTELIKDGVPTGKRIPGYIIEAQYAHTHGFVLVTSWDCPYEEALSFLLLSHECDLLFEKTIGGAYSSVGMEGHEPVDKDAVMFHCDGDLDILATVDTATTLRLEKLHRVNSKQ